MRTYYKDPAQPELVVIRQGINSRSFTLELYFLKLSRQPTGR